MPDRTPIETGIVRLTILVEKDDVISARVTAQCTYVDQGREQAVIEHLPIDLSPEMRDQLSAILAAHYDEAESLAIEAAHATRFAERKLPARRIEVGGNLG